MNLHIYIKTFGPLLVGQVIVFTDGTEILVGNVNPLGGICDDCPYSHYEGLDKEVDVEKTR